MIAVRSHGRGAGDLLDVIEPWLDDLERHAARAVERLDAALQLRSAILAASERHGGHPIELEDVLDVPDARERARLRALVDRLAAVDDDEPETPYQR